MAGSTSARIHPRLPRQRRSEPLAVHGSIEEMHAERRANTVLAAIVLLAGCGKDVRSHLDQPFPKKLSAWKLFVGKPADLVPNRGVVPFDLNTTLFTDYATKRRFVWMPPGQAAVYKADEPFEFPQGNHPFEDVFLSRWRKRAPHRNAPPGQHQRRMDSAAVRLEQ